MKKLLEIKKLCASVEDKDILKGVDLKINAGEVHVVMGPNGAGKSTLANVIFNNPQYKKTAGCVLFDGVDITNLSTDKIAKMGVFLSFQSPEEIAGISVLNFLKIIKSNKSGQTISTVENKKEVTKNAKKLNLNENLLMRDFNVGFSGGEKKKNEILQMLELSPRLAILDETDSGLDADAVKTVSKGINLFKNADNAVLIITHSTKILQNLDVDYVHILIDGKIVKTGGIDLAKQIETSGFDEFRGEDGKN